MPPPEGFAAFWHGDYAVVVERLHGARHIASAFDGSHAQRDIIHWTLTEAEEIEFQIKWKHQS